MILLTSFSCQMVLLVSFFRGCQSQEIRMSIPNVEVWKYNDPRSFIHKHQVLIKVSDNQDEYFFEDPQLQEICGQRFSSQNVEIRHANGRLLTFSLIIAEKNLTFECLFSTERDLQLFFSQIRKTYVVEAADSVSVNRTVLRAADGTVIPFANNGLFYRKPIYKSREVQANFSYNLVRQYHRLNPQTGETIQTQEADLVFLSSRFNITDLMENNKVGICPSFLPNSIFILRFAHSQDASFFRRLVRMDKNSRIPCSVSDNWLSQHKHLIDQPGPFNLPRQPYLGQ